MEEAEDEPLFCERRDRHRQAGGDGHRPGAGRAPWGGRAQETREFGTTRRQLLELADWLRSWGVERAGMESTSDYWKPVFFLLEQAAVTLAGSASTRALRVKAAAPAAIEGAPSCSPPGASFSVP